jgi:hypothetical protein
MEEKSMKKVFSMRVSEYTLSKIDQILKLTGMSKTEMVTIAINNLYIDVVYDQKIFSRIKSELLMKKIKKQDEPLEIRNEIIARLESLGGYKDDFFPFFMRSNKDYIIRLIEHRAKEYGSMYENT